MGEVAGARPPSVVSPASLTDWLGPGSGGGTRPGGGPDFGLTQHQEGQRAQETNDGHRQKGYVVIPGEVADAEQVVSAFIEEREVNRNGPGFRDLDGERTVAVGLPVHLPDPDKLPPAGKDAPRFTIESPHRILTTIVTQPDPEALRTAEQRLREHASLSSLEQSGPVRHVEWKKSIVQVQLPVKGR